MSQQLFTYGSENSVIALPTLPRFLNTSDKEESDSNIDSSEAQKP